MFGLLKFLFYTFVAVVVGVLIGTVPVGGHTLAERIAAEYRGMPQLLEAAKKAAPAPATPKTSARTSPRLKSTPVPAPVPAPPPPASSAPAMAKAPVSAGAANTPDAQSDEDKAQLNQVIAARVRGK